MGELSAKLTEGDFDSLGWTATPTVSPLRADPPPPHRASRWGRILGPGRQGRHGRQDRLDVAAGLEAEHGAAVVEQVELDITAATDQLLLPLGVGPVLVEVLADQMRVDDLEGAADILDKAEVGNWLRARAADLWEATARKSL